MNQLVTRGIVLRRINYGEADRILTLLTPEYGKLRLMARGVRKVKSKLAGGIELFSVSQVTFIRGKGDIGTLVSTRLETHYGNIIGQIERVQLGYELIKQLDKATEDIPEADYFTLLEASFAALHDLAMPPGLIQLWFTAQLLRLAGLTPNLSHDQTGVKLAADQRYVFSFDDGAFVARPNGSFGSHEIKFLRLLFGNYEPAVLARIDNLEQLTRHCQPLVTGWRQHNGA